MICPFPVWKTLRLGEHKSYQGYLCALREKRVPVICEPNVQVADPEREVHLARVFSGAGVAGIPGETTQEIYSLLWCNGLTVCPHEVALALALVATPEDLFGNHLMIGALPRKPSTCSPYLPAPKNQQELFYLKNDRGEVSLTSLVSNGNWNTIVPWVFVIER